MTQPEHRPSRPSEYQSLAASSLESLASETSPDRWQSSLLDAFMDSVGKDGMSPETFELLEKMYNSAAATRQRNMEASAEALESPHTTAALGTRAITDIESLSGSLENEMIDQESSNAENADRERIVQEAINATSQVTFSGKFPGGLDVGRVNDKIAPLKLAINASADYLTYSHHTPQGVWAHRYKTPYSTVASLRAVASRGGKTKFKNETSSDFLIFRHGNDTKTQQPLVEVTFNRNSDHLVDDFNRGVYNIGVSAMLPAKEGSEFQRLCEQGDRVAIDEFISKVAPGLKEIEGPKHDIIVTTYNQQLFSALTPDGYTVNDTALGQILEESVIVKP